MDDQVLQDQMRRKKRASVAEAALHAGGSGGLYGGVLGLADAVLGGKKRMGEIALQALKGAGIGAGVAGGSTAVGSTLMGVPDEGDPSGYTKRGAIGGALAGGLGGSVLGGMAGTGHLPVGSKTLLHDAFRAMSRHPYGGAMGALAGGALGALGASYLGGDEGMALDFMNREMQDEKRKKLAQRYAAQAGGDSGAL